VRLGRKQGFAALTKCLALAASAVALAEEPSIGESLDEALRAFEQQGHRLFYSSDLVRPWMQVETKPDTRDPVEALTQILAPHGLKLRRGLNDSWLIVRAPRPQSPAAETPAGRLVAGGSDQRPRREQSRLPVEEVIVAASQYEIRRTQTAPGWQIRDFTLESLPNLGDDTLRATARLPGMASNGWSALSNVRGGEIGETLVRLDGLRLYHPFHLKDFQNVFSAIDSRIVESIDVYTGGFPASFGGRMSGVIDVATMPGPTEPHHEIGFSFFNSSFLSSGRFGEGQNEWMASIRRSNLDILYDRFSDQPERPRYTDVFAKLGFGINDRLELTANILRVEDDISLSDDVDREERAQSTQLDSYAWIKLDHEINGAMSGSTVVARTSFDSDRFGTTAKSGLSQGSLEDQRTFTIDELRTEWSRVIAARMLLEFGGSLARANGRYSYRDDVSYDLLFAVGGAPDSSTRSRELRLAPESRELSLFSTLRFDWTDSLTTEFGVRWQRHDLGQRDDTMLSPRFGLRYSVSDDLAFRASWGRFYQTQAINELQVSDGITEFFAPQRSDQIVVGVDWRITEGLELRVEGYEKSMNRLRPRFENLLNPRVLLPELKPDRIRIAPTSASARGIEATLDGRIGRFQWWSSLSRARVHDRFGESTVPRSWDQSYAFNAGFSWDTAKWTLSTGLAYRAGWPTTAVMLDPAAATPTVTTAGRNGARLEAFGSLDLRVSRTFALRRSQLDVSLEFANLTNRYNPCCVEFEIGEEENAGRLMLDELSYLPTIPSVGVLWQF
jgi:outer membrane receptor protein involved in Fe transport